MVPFFLQNVRVLVNACPFGFTAVSAICLLLNLALDLKPFVFHIGAAGRRTGDAHRDCPERRSCLPSDDGCRFFQSSTLSDLLEGSRSPLPSATPFAKLAAETWPSVVCPPFRVFIHDCHAAPISSSNVRGNVMGLPVLVGLRTFFTAVAPISSTVKVNWFD